jgi:tetratricopeptide (TPR) repeat protein
MAKLYVLQKDFKNAESRYRKLLDANPGDVEVRADLGDLRMREGAYARSEAEYATIKKRVPNHPMGYVKLSSVYIIQQKWDKAITELEHAVKIQPGQWSIMNDLAVLLSDYSSGQKDLDRALAFAEKARSLNPDNPNIYDTVGWVHYRKGDFKKALHWLGQAQKKDPQNPVLNYHLGMAYYKNGNTAKAREYLRIALASKTEFHGKKDAAKIMAGTM